MTRPGGEKIRKSARQQPYRPSDPNNKEVHAARKRFLGLYRHHRPEMLAALSDRTLDLFREWRTPSLPPFVDELDWYGFKDQTEASKCVDSITTWMKEFGLTHHGEPVDWAAAFVIVTLDHWTRHPDVGRKLEWQEPTRLLEEFPEGEPGFFSSWREPETEVFQIRFAIDAWAWAAGETDRQFRSRFTEKCRAVREAHISEIKALREEWSKRQLLGKEYLEALAMRKAGSDWARIHQYLESQGKFVGSDEDRTALVHGCERAAQTIQLDL